MNCQTLKTGIFNMLEVVTGQFLYVSWHLSEETRKPSLEATRYRHINDAEDSFKSPRRCLKVYIYYKTIS